LSLSDSTSDARTSQILRQSMSVAAAGATTVPPSPRLVPPAGSPAGVSMASRTWPLDASQSPVPPLTPFDLLPAEAGLRPAGGAAATRAVGDDDDDDGVIWPPLFPPLLLPLVLVLVPPPELLLLPLSFGA
ncbi:unnamed protein product, partial [Ectocarpus sp. 12 AP-2014]